MLCKVLCKVVNWPSRVCVCVCDRRTLHITRHLCRRHCCTHKLSHKYGSITLSSHRSATYPQHYTDTMSAEPNTKPGIWRGTCKNLDLQQREMWRWAKRGRLQWVIQRQGNQQVTMATTRSSWNHDYVLFNSILCYSILFYSILFYCILCFLYFNNHSWHFYSESHSFTYHNTILNDIIIVYLMIS